MRRAALAIAWIVGVAAGGWADVWHEELSYSGGGTWNVRVPVEVTNPSEQALEAVPVAITLDADTPATALIGTPTASLRAVIEDGAELVFALHDAQGTPRRDGALAEGDTIVLPADVAPNATAKIYLYAGNASAWLPPEWLKGDLANTGFEEGLDAPTQWLTADTDASHRMSLERGHAHGGEVCARCDVDAGAEPSWVKYYQNRIPVRVGERYRFTAWVKGEGVEDKAGWFVHVDGAEPQLVNRVEGLNGDFDWHEVAIEFDVPEGGQFFTCGTVLRGSGRAWYDDAGLERMTEDSDPAVRVLDAEQRDLAQLGSACEWPVAQVWGWRVPLIVRNFSDTAKNGCLVTCDTRRIYNRIEKLVGFNRDVALRLVDPDSPDTAIAVIGALADTVQFLGYVPERSEKTFWLSLGLEINHPDHSEPQEMAALSASPLNLLINGTMEEVLESGGPAGWVCDEEGTQDGARFLAARTSDGIEGEACLKLTVPETVDQPRWVGWRQRVNVKPQTRYVLAGYLKTRGVDKNVALHGHFRRADGTHTENPFWGTQCSLRDDTDWTFTSTTVTTPADCATIEVHLTMDGHGTVWHDAVLLTEVCTGSAGNLEFRDRIEEPLAAWIVNPLVKVFRDDRKPVNAPGEADIAAARGTFEAFQLCLRAAQDAEARIAASPLVGPGLAEIAPPDVSLVGYVPIDFPVGYDHKPAPAHHRLAPRWRGNDGWRDLWPDPLLPAADGAVKLAADQTQPIFVDVHVPEDAAPGVYKGHVTIQARDQSVDVPVSLTVWGFIAPAKKHITAIYDLRSGPGWNIFNGPDENEMMKTWYRFLARYNVSPGLLYPDATFAYKDGQISMDTAAFDAMAEFLFDELHVPKVYTPWFFYACGWAYMPKAIFGFEFGTPEYTAAWREAYRQFIAHITARGWRDRFCYYLSDEPHDSSPETIDALARVADMAREIAPDVPIYSSTWHYIEGLANHLTLWGMGPQGSFDAERHAERQAAGDRFWFTTDGQMCTDTPLLAIERLLPWFCLRYGVEAYEFWGVSWWTYDPWEFGWHTYIDQSNEGEDWYRVRYPNGDGFLAYPSPEGPGHEPRPSIRLVAARDGVDDYELFYALGEVAKGGNPLARAMLDRAAGLVVMPNKGGRFSTDIMPDPDIVQETRRAVGNLLSQLAGNAKP
ncbi:MAG TPA: DUF6067 family protein [Candidatus Hydrogenedentes bacterium]|nr:DUF6067 family protein [Candidatus Hydrogenedentota bacterium]HPG68420.1 DUF6067 family protein [Candidatus Hydrogenedentota bacterium]